MQSSYSPVLQRQNRQGNVEQNAATDNDINNDDDEQLIENESETPKNHPYMRASKVVSMEEFFVIFSSSMFLQHYIY